MRSRGSFINGTIQPDIKLTGILNTYVMYPGEDTKGWGTEVPEMIDAVASDAPVGSPENFYGNAFYAKRTKLETTAQAMTDYNGSTSRSWDIINENKLNPHSGKPVSYKIVSREVPGLLPKEGSLVWKRLRSRGMQFMLPDVNHDDQLWVAGDHVPQTSGEPSKGITEWVGDGTESITNTDIVLWHTFGITHFPSPEDYPIMPREPSRFFCARHFFSCNPVLDVPPSYSVTLVRWEVKGEGALDETDRISKLALGGSRLE
ncbi:hypothetical protein ACKAV7_014012 [Fusarium commune]